MNVVLRYFAIIFDQTVYCLMSDRMYIEVFFSFPKPDLKGIVAEWRQKLSYMDNHIPLLVLRHCEDLCLFFHCSVWLDSFLLHTTSIFGICSQEYITWILCLVITFCLFFSLLILINLNIASMHQFDFCEGIQYFCHYQSNMIMVTTSGDRCSPKEQKLKILFYCENVLWHLDFIIRKKCCSWHVLYSHKIRHEGRGETWYTEVLISP